MWKRIKERISNWYYGPWELFPAPIIGGVHTPHWTARIAQALVKFWFNHWKWIIGTCIALASLWIAYNNLLTTLKH